MVDVLGIYTEYLKEENALHKEKYIDYDGWFSASTAGSCFKKQLLRKENAKETPFDDRVLRLLRLGTIVHEDIQKSISDNVISSNIDYKIYMEHRITIPELKVVGHLDIGIADSDNNLKVSDIKTCAGYKWKMKFGRTPDKRGNPNYNMQLSTYMLGLSKELNPNSMEMSLLWYNKDTSAVREEFIDISWMKKAEHYWEDLNDRCEGATSEDLNPGMYGVPMENWECRYCGFKDIYCKGVN